MRRKRQEIELGKFINVVGDIYYMIERVPQEDGTFSPEGWFRLIEWKEHENGRKTVEDIWESNEKNITHMVDRNYGILISIPQ